MIGSAREPAPVLAKVAPATAGGSFFRFADVTSAFLGSVNQSPVAGSSSVPTVISIVPRSP